MLEKLSIQNIALIRNQSIEFTDGLNVLTGETGAGKSLIIDSLSLLLGEKADKTLITYGEKQAIVEAVFTKLNKNVKQIMLELGLEEDDVLVITRKITTDGKNECRVNGNLFSLSMLRKISAPLMDLHGQFEHQNLLKVSNHLNILDLFGGKDVVSLKSEFEALVNEYRLVLEELDGYTTDDQERERLIELYNYQMQEIDDAGFYDGEEEHLKEYRNQVLHQEKILESLNSATKILGGDGYEYAGALESIKKASSLISSITAYYKDSEDILNRIESSKIELDDIVDTMQSQIDNMYFDEEMARKNEERLDLLSSFKKKYGNSIEAINKYREHIGQECEKLVNSYKRVDKLKKEKEKLKSCLLLVGNNLSQKRKEVSKEFSKCVKEELRALGMKNADFVVQFETLDVEKFMPSGLDKVEFMFSANLGEIVKPLKNVASGGEMSRFMLAVKNITAKIEGISTLVFDEIDTGVSGKIALVLAEKLASVSKMAQVICVTHLAQIASFGKNHLFIEKTENDNKTTTNIIDLSKKERIQEIARLISGNITENSILNAQEMLEYGMNFYKNL